MSAESQQRNAHTIPAPHAGEKQGKIRLWTIDAAHSEVNFSIKHMMISTVRGKFDDFHGHIDFDPDHPNEASIDVTIDVASIDTGNEQRDNHLRSADFFDAEKYPTITFVSRRIEPLDKDHFKVIGDLTMHGVTRQVVLDSCFEGTGKDPWGNTRAAFTATAKLNREDFGLTWNTALESGGVLVGPDVKISLDVQAIEQG